ncbi:Glycosyl hydrolase, BNR repeat precursor [Fulvivirga imtechensis AK7]|uniref:Glycosyl hydrolase, BNR repeat n=1 Tax=Fulvivirga imtechensis AK7 TaxID=1237149 RepID=L8JPX9_9BACT|nr:glycosyl hydrolase BNR repeat precursor [Fulvivirga imtechensis]ELR69437.1 Glycosyl hydrolase, BNR repeat precursor [Fulvivirga imtechensis AK7]
MKKILIALAAFTLSVLCYGQTETAGQPDIATSFAERKKLAGNSLVAGYKARNIGPVVQGGRIVDIAVNTSNTKEYYVAYASGGIFKTRNNGITFEPVFDDQGAMGIGAMALAPSDNKTIYVGTGENNSSRSSYAGSGVYKSVDGGQTWRHLGFASTQHIGKIVVHPNDPDQVWVASIGALYTHNVDRGVYKSTDGGQTWKKTLFINDSTGIIDLVINPQNPNQLFASAWERTRKAWSFKGSGPGSGIYRSNDGGDSWTRIMDGFPDGEMVGRIGLNISASSPNIVYAFLDNQAEAKKEKKADEDKDKLKLTDFRDMTPQHLLNLDDEKLNGFLKDNSFPEKYNAQRIKKEIRQGKYQPIAISEYFGDANAALFNTSVVGAELYRSDDSGETWKRMNSYDLEGVYFTYGYYFGEVRVAPDNPDLVYVFGVPLLKSTDGGVTYARIDSIGDVHVDHQALWINPNDSKHLLLGNDGGLYESYDEGANWRHINNMPVGQFYTVNVDMEKPYNVYGGLQDNGTLIGSSKSVPNRTKHWEQLFGGDGMFVSPDPRNKDIVYTGFQFGNYYRVDRSKNDFTKVTPQHDIGEPVLRFNWRTPLILSSHNPDIVYIGAQRVYRSLNRGDDWQAISPDLTKDKPQNNVPFSTISAISESPLRFGLIYVGTDDGNVHVTRGDEWALITEGLPRDKWVSSVFASPHEEAEVYVSLNGYREDEFKTYVFMSDNYGKTWRSLKGNLPEVVVNDLLQDPVNPDLLYVGTDHGTYVSFNKGTTWEILDQIPNVASYDLMVHPRDNELVVGTHGRSIYIVDVKPFQAIAGHVDVAVKVFEPGNIRHSERWGEKRYPYLKAFEPEIAIGYYIGQATPAAVIEIYNAGGELVRRLEGKGAKGFHTVKWDVKVQQADKKKKKKEEPEMQYAAKGKYSIKVINAASSDQTSLEIK